MSDTMLTPNIISMFIQPCTSQAIITASAHLANSSEIGVDGFFLQKLLKGLQLAFMNRSQVYLISHLNREFFPTNLNMLK